MITLNPNKKEIADVSKFAEEYDRGGYGKNVLGVSHEEYINFIRIGKLCELVFVRFLRNKNINVKCPDILTPCKDEHKKGADLILTYSNQSVDVKAANKPFHIRMLVREDQFKAHVHDVYIGAKYVSNNEIEFHGYLLGEDLNKICPKDFGYGKCRHVLLKDLKPIEKFIQLCQDKEVII